MAHDEAHSAGGEDSVDKVSARAATIYRFPGSKLPDSNMRMVQKKRNRCGYHAGVGARSVMHSIEAIPTTVPYASQPLASTP